MVQSTSDKQLLRKLIVGKGGALSLSEATRLIVCGAVKVDGEYVRDMSATVGPDIRSITVKKKEILDI